VEVDTRAARAAAALAAVRPLTEEEMGAVMRASHVAPAQLSARRTLNIDALTPSEGMRFARLPFAFSV
jgi:hypothetical protein